MQQRGGAMVRPTWATVVATVAFCTAAAVAGAETLDPIVWTNGTNVTISGDAVTKTAGCDGCGDAGAVGTQDVNAGGGVEFVPSAAARLYAGLGNDRSSSTSPSAIAFSFSFWPGGTWDIREGGVYRAEGPFVNGDRFRVVADAAEVRYYVNDALVYTTSATPAFPLVADTTIYTAGGGLVSAKLTGGSAPPPPPPPPDPDTVMTDRIARTEPSLPSIGAAGATFVDPVFGSTIARITDGLVRPGLLNRSFRTPSGTHQNAWSASGRYFSVVSTDGTVIPYQFDATTRAATRITPSKIGDGGFVLRFFNEPQFSYVRDGIAYGTYNGSGSTLHTVDEYDFATGTYTRVIDLETIASNLAGTYVGGIGSSAGATERISVFFGGTSQDRHYLLLVADRQDVTRRKLVDTLASTVNGVATNITLNFKLHHAFIDRSGRYVMLYPTGVDRAAPRNAAPVYVWDLDTDYFTELPSIAARSNGHDAPGYGTIVNQDCCTTTTWDAAQWQFRWLDSPLSTSDLIAPVLTPKEVYLADHPSWHNARQDQLMPFISGLYRYGANAVEWRAWDDEIIAVQTSVAPAGGATVWRLAHHRSDVTNDADATRTYFWYTPRANVSPDGRWVLFTSNWEKTLGTDPGAEPGGAARQDVFLLEVRPGVMPTAGGPVPFNGAPVVNAGADRTITLPTTSTTLTGTATDDGQPNPPGALTAAWSSVSGPGTVTFGDAGALSTTASFSIDGVYVLRLTVSDGGIAVTDDVTITVNPAPPPEPLVITTTSLPDARRNTAYSATLQATGGTPPVTWSIVSGSLPPGMALNASTGTISGTCSQRGTWSFTVRVTDTAGVTDDQALSLRVRRNSG